MAIAPHVNNEVRLVLAGSKPLATIERSKDENNYALAVSLSNAGLLVGRCQPTEDSPTGEILIVKPSNRSLVHQYDELQANGIRKVGIKQYHREMGKLFGYTPEDIEDFINAEIDCNCTKCKGK